MSKANTISARTLVPRGTTVQLHLTHEEARACIRLLPSGARSDIPFIKKLIQMHPKHAQRNKSASYQVGLLLWNGYTEIVNYAILSCKCDKHPVKALFNIEFDIMPHGNQQGNELRSVLSQKQA